MKLENRMSIRERIAIANRFLISHNGYGLQGLGFKKIAMNVNHFDMVNVRLECSTMN